MSQYTHLLFDADNTLLDFSDASKKALFQSMKEHDLHCNEEIYKIYKKENGKVWDAFEDKQITAEELRPLRFERFFNAADIRGPHPGAFNAHYLNNLIQLSEIYDGVRSMIDRLGQKYTLGIITNGLREVQRARFERLDFTHPFETIVVSDEIGVAKPHVDFFNHTYDQLPTNPEKEQILVIGDNIKSDIHGGNSFGAHTCWISHERENNTGIVPTYTVGRPLDIEGVLG